jgi:hypothetical protein
MQHAMIAETKSRICGIVAPNFLVVVDSPSSIGRPFTEPASGSVEAVWSSRPARLVKAASIATVLIGGVGLIEANRLFELPGRLENLPTVHLAAIAWAVTALLVFEVVDMVLSLSRSVADSVGRHLQVFALLLLRDAFAKLAEFPEPISLSREQYAILGVMGADAAGALLVFAGSTWFAKLQRHRPIVTDERVARRFVAIKRAISAALLGIFAWLCARDVAMLLWGSGVHEVFDHFFTVLVFVDVLLAVIALGFSSKPPIVFRNFGFAFAAILIRLAVASPDYVRPGLGLASVIVAIAVTAAYNWALAESPNGDPFERPGERVGRGSRG